MGWFWGTETGETSKAEPRRIVADLVLGCWASVPGRFSSHVLALAESFMKITTGDRAEEPSLQHFPAHLCLLGWLGASPSILVTFAFLPSTKASWGLRVCWRAWVTPES